MESIDCCLRFVIDMKLKNRQDEIREVTNVYNNVMKRGMKNTALYSGNSKKVRITVNKNIRDVVSNVAKYRNKKASQGIVAYEWMMMYESKFNDMITDFESSIDKKLKTLGIDPKFVDQVQWCEKLVIDSDKEKRMNVWIPMRVHKQHNSEHYHNLITKAIEYGYNSIYRDRKERIDVKKSLVKYVVSDRDKPNNQKAKMIVNNNFDVDVPDQLLNEISGYIIYSKDDYLNIADNLESWSKRYKALNDWVQYEQKSFDVVFKTLKEAHNLTDEEYLRNKLSKFGRVYNHDYLVPDEKIKYSQKFDISVSDIKEKYLTEDYTLEEVVIGYINTRNGLNKIDGNKLLKNVKSEFGSISEFENWVENTKYLTDSSHSTDIFPGEYLQTKNDLRVKKKDFVGW